MLYKNPWPSLVRGNAVKTCECPNLKNITEPGVLDRDRYEELARDIPFDLQSFADSCVD